MSDFAVNRRGFVSSTAALIASPNALLRTVSQGTIPVQVLDGLARWFHSAVSVDEMAGLLNQLTWNPNLFGISFEDIEDCTIENDEFVRDMDLLNFTLYLANQEIEKLSSENINKLRVFLETAKNETLEKIRNNDKDWVDLLKYKTDCCKRHYGHMSDDDIFEEAALSACREVFDQTIAKSDLKDKMKKIILHSKDLYDSASFMSPNDFNALRGNEEINLKNLKGKSLANLNKVKISVDAKIKKLKDLQEKGGIERYSGDYLSLPEYYEKEISKLKKDLLNINKNIEKLKDDLYPKTKGFLAGTNR